jgi:hypothetical protein
MTHFSLKMTALALAGIIAAAPAQAGGLFDSDDNGYPGSYNRQNLDAYCDLHPDDDACDDEPQYKKKTYKKSHHSDRCAALIRAAGKRNLVTVFARNSARFAWRREARAVHGNQYANWHNARNPQITCTRIGALKSCIARATPCRY